MDYLKPAVLLFIICMASATEVKNKAKHQNSKVPKQDKKDGSDNPSSVDSRFFDFGGIFNHLFSGFNQGMQGGSQGNPGGMDFPSNSQFYPGGFGQNQLPQNQQGGFPNWSIIDDAKQFPNNGQTQFPNQGNPMQSGNQGNFGQQFPGQGGQGNFGQQFPSQGGQGNFGQQFPNQGGQGGRPPVTFPAQGNDNGRPQMQNPNQGSFGRRPNENGRRPPNQQLPQGGSGINDGTLNGIMGAPVTEPDQEDGFGNGGTGNAILGRPVVIPPSTTAPGSVVFPSSTESPSQRQCVQDCQTTTEYSPVCGTNNVTYFNQGRFICARNCGVDVFVASQGRCAWDTPFPRNAMIKRRPTLN